MNTAIIGMQFGDEGKGKLVDALTQQHDIVVRYAGGANAGHTVVVDNEKFVLHLIPCGAIYGKQNVIGNGVVLNLDRLTEEIDQLKKQGKELAQENLLISERAHIVTPYSTLLELAKEITRNKQTGTSIGTTLQGIGPTYEFKAGRMGMRLCDLINDCPAELETKIIRIASESVSRIQAMGISTQDVSNEMNKNERAQKMTTGFKKYFDDATYVNLQKVMESLNAHKEQLKKFTGDASVFLDDHIRNGKKIMFEGAQGTLLDIDHGSWPYVTSSSTTIGGALTGTGIYVPIEHRIGVLKAYTTRVGNGSFPTELNNAVGNRIQTKGQEVGATTGRARRCGWLDLVMSKYSARVNGINEIALTKLDILDFEDPIMVAVAYKIDSKMTKKMPASDKELATAEPVYVALPGWNQDTSNVQRFEELPIHARNYVEFIETRLEAPIKYISTGQKRNQLITKGT